MEELEGVARVRKRVVRWGKKGGGRGSERKQKSLWCAARVRGGARRKAVWGAPLPNPSLFPSLALSLFPSSRPSSLRHILCKPRDMQCNRFNNGAAVMAAGRSPEARKLLFFAACVPLRATLAVGVMALTAHLPRWCAAAAIPAGLALFIYNTVLQERAACRWWYPGTTAILGLAAAGTGVLVLLRRASANLLGGLLLAQVASGVASAIVEKPWDAPRP